MRGTWRNDATVSTRSSMKGSIRSRDANDGAGIPPAPIGLYLTRTWLPSKQVTLRPSTWDSYRRNIELHVLPELGRVPIRHVRVEHLERLYAKLLDHGRETAPWSRHEDRARDPHGATPRGSPTRHGAGSSPATRPTSRTHQNADRSPAPNNAGLECPTTQGVSRPRRRPRSNGQCLVQRPTKPHSTTAEGFRFDRWGPRQRSSCVQLGFRTRSEPCLQSVCKPSERAEAPHSAGPLTCAYMVAGEDLNLRPSGYEPDSTALLTLSTP